MHTSFALIETLAMNSKTFLTSTSEKVPQLVHSFGPLIGGMDLAKVLGFRNQPAFRQAVYRGRIPIRLFSIPGRRGKFAMTTDVDAWLTELQDVSTDPEH